jgi:hypothetical protein
VVIGFIFSTFVNQAVCQAFYVISWNFNANAVIESRFPQVADQGITKQAGPVDL